MRKFCLGVGAPLLGLSWGLVLASCSSGTSVEQPPTVREVTESLIDTVIEGQAELGDLTPTCPDVPVPSVGLAWECVATTEDQREVQIAAGINEMGRVELETKNLIVSSAIPSFESAAAAALVAKNPGVNLEAEAIDCGAKPILLPASQVMLCTLVDPQTQGVFDMTLTVIDIETRQFSLVVADAPRP